MEEFWQAVSVDIVNEACGVSMMKIGPAVEKEGIGHGFVASTRKMYGAPGQFVLG
jgi:hypothetical protein